MSGAESTEVSLVDLCQLQPCSRYVNRVDAPTEQSRV